MKVLAVINQKGGVGKSTTALAVGAGLMLEGYRVLFIDLDSQGNLSYTLGADSNGYNALGVLQRPETTKEEIQHTAQGDVIASSPALATADGLLIDTGKEYKLKEALETIQGLYDYVMVDTPPALGILTVNALTACTGALIPAQADIYSLQGIRQLNTTVETVKRYCNPALVIKGIVLTRYNARTIIGIEVAEMLEQMASQLNTKLYKSRIREATTVKEAQAKRESIYSYAPKSNPAHDYKALVSEILEDEREN